MRGLEAMRRAITQQEVRFGTHLVAFRIIWRNASELFGLVSALRRNPSQTEATNMAVNRKQNQIFTL
jgi:hypothetical protein